MIGTTRKKYLNVLKKLREDSDLTKETSAAVVAALKGEKAPVAKEILNLEQYLIKKSQWIFGGDGWAYDIGYSGVDHVVSNTKNVIARKHWE